MKKYYKELSLVLITIIWGVGFVVTKNSIEVIGPLTFIAWRFVIASLVMVAIFRRRAIRAPLKGIAAGGLIGVFLGLGYLMQTIGLKMTTNGKTAFITGMYVVIVPILAIFLLKRKPSPQVLMGVVLGAFGLGLLSINDDFRMNVGDYWVLGCAAFFALHLIAISYFVARYSEVSLACYQIFVTAVLALVISIIFEDQSWQAVLSQWWPLVFTGALGTAYAFYAMTWAQKSIPPTRTGLILLLESPFGAFFGWLLADEYLTGRQLTGCLLIFAAMVLSELKPRKRRATTPLPAES